MPATADSGVQTHSNESTRGHAGMSVEEPALEINLLTKLAMCEVLDVNAVSAAAWLLWCRSCSASADFRLPGGSGSLPSVWKGRERFLIARQVPGILNNDGTYVQNSSCWEV
nr:kyphoscoliosis peptidase [Pomacea canaliculata]